MGVSPGIAGGRQDCNCGKRFPSSMLGGLTVAGEASPDRLCKLRAESRPVLRFCAELEQAETNHAQRAITTTASCVR